jgi:hypothetical protein
MKFVAIIDGKKTGEDRIISYISNDNDPVPFVVDPPDPDEAKDTEPPKPEPKPS